MLGTRHYYQLRCQLILAGPRSSVVEREIPAFMLPQGHPFNPGRGHSFSISFHGLPTFHQQILALGHFRACCHSPENADLGSSDYSNRQARPKRFLISSEARHAFRWKLDESLYSAHG